MFMLMKAIELIHEEVLDWIGIPDRNEKTSKCGRICKKIGNSCSANSFLQKLSSPEHVG